MSKRNITVATIALVAVVVLFLLFKPSGSSDSEILISASQGKFVVDVTTTGELEAKNSVKILGPKGLRNYRIWNVSIQKIIEEGTYVEKGQFVASLDASELTTKINETALELDKSQSQYTQTKLDTTLQMRETRDQLVNLEYAVREKQLVLDQSQFEPPATIQKAEIELEKAKRELSQAKENYKIKKDQNVAKMQEVNATVNKTRFELEGMQALASNFTILAPEDGMLIYKKDWRGNPIKEGSQVSAWDPVVATLPDLSKMLSQTYVNEVDIRKIKVGQDVEIGLDAFPEKKLTGKVVKVANVGEQRPNSDAKVFLVSVEVNESDDLLRPAMTTSNRIIVEQLEEVVYVPLECIHNQNDSITYVFKKSGLGIEKQEVLLGNTNNNEVVIESGISSNDKVYLSNPLGMENEEISLLPELNGKRNKPLDNKSISLLEGNKR